MISIADRKRYVAFASTRPCAFTSLCTCIILGLAAPIGALGAEAAAADSAGETHDDSQVQEVVVTAQFRKENLQRTPLAITAVTSELMEARSQTSITEVATRAPSVTLLAGGQGGGSQTTTASIRGIGQADWNMALEPGVALYVDDVYYGVMYGSTFELLDLDRVEVLRGPQGTLSGKNSEGGAIKLYSKQPNAETNGYVEATRGSYDRTDVRAGAGFVLVPDTLFARFSGIAKHREGYVKRLDYQCVTGQAPAPVSAGSLANKMGSCEIGKEGGQDVTGARVALRWLASDTITDDLIADALSDKSDASPTVMTYQGVWHGPGYNLLAGIANTPANFVPSPGSYYNYANYTALIGTPNQYTLPAASNARSWGIANTLSIELAANWSLKLITAGRHLAQQSAQDGDGSPLSRFLQYWDVSHKQFTQEVRLNGSVGTVADGTVGAYYYRADDTQAGRIDVDGATDNLIPVYLPVDFLTNDPVAVRSKSAFAHLVLHPLEKLNLTAGLRYTDDRKSYGFGRSLAPGVAPNPVSDSITALNGMSSEFKGSRWDWRAAVDSQVLPDLNLYAQVATGFKGGGINPRPYYALQVRPFVPETVTSYEIGTKSDLFDRHLRVNVAAFINKVKNLQLMLGTCPQFVPPGAPQNCAMTANVGDATTKGLELETEIHPLAGLVVDGSVSYTHFTYDNVDPGSGVTLDMQPQFTPKWKYAVGAQYQWPLGSLGSITPRIDYAYQSKIYSDAINSERGTVAGYGLANARITYHDPREVWELAFAATNLFDKYYFINMYDRSPPANTTYQVTVGQPGPPRQYLVTLKRTF